MRRSQVPSLKKKRLLNNVANETDSTDRQLATFPNRSLARAGSSQTNQQAGSDNNFQVFTVVYGCYKPGKKHKEWTNDAILVLNSKLIKIFDLEGECIASSPYTKNRPLVKDDTLLIGSKEYMIIDPISREDYESKRCFLSNTSYQPSNQSTEQFSSKTLKRKLPDYVSPLKSNSHEEDHMNFKSNQIFELPSKLSKRSFNETIENQDKTNEPYQVFKILYGTYKPTKKHKDWENDAIMVRKGINITMYSIDGEKLQTEIYRKSKHLKPDEILLAFGKEIQISDPINIQDFESGQCFQEGFCSMAENDNIELKKSEVVTFRNVVTNLTLEAVNQSKRKVINPQIDTEKEEENPFEVELFFLPAMPNEHAMATEPEEIMVDFELTKHLRTHQREGVEFMYKCITGFHSNVRGCILADEMGLGKTLQCITLIYTLIKKGPFKTPYFYNRILIITPSSLVQNWRKEFDKWLKNKKFCIFAVDGKKKTVQNYMKQSRSIFPVLILSYDMFQRNYNLLTNFRFDLIVCDEGHRLKNSKTKVFDTIRGMECRRRILLTGTPVQNNLKELYSLSDLVNPGILGNQEEFYKNYEEPINLARKQRDENSSSDKFEEMLIDSKGVEEELHRKLFEIISPFFMRRLQSSFNYLPKRVDNVVICNLTEIQRHIYQVLLEDKNLKKLFSNSLGSKMVKSYLPYISFLRKLCNHPFLINANIIEKSYALNETSLIKEFSPVVSDVFNMYQKGVMDKSGKFDVLVNLLKSIKEINEKVVIVSHFTQTLDLIHQYCKIKNYKTTRLDGSTSITHRQKLVDEFNCESSTTFVFLLSSKAGGLGLNLIGASHIILYDIDWNPAHDEQAMARIFRDGQKKTANIYRLLTVGTIEEKIFQRQLDKQNLSAAVGYKKSEVQFTNRELKDIFTLVTETCSIVHDALNCTCLENKKFDLSSHISDDDLEDGSTDDQGHIKPYEVEPVKIKKEKTDPGSDVEYDTDASYDQFPDNDNIELEADENSENELNCAPEEAIDLDVNLIKENDISKLKPSYEMDEDFSEESDEEKNTKITKFTGTKPLLEWQHLSHPFDQFELSSALIELKNKISFVFRTESQ